MTLSLRSNRNCLFSFVASVFLLPPQSSFSDTTCKSAMPDGYTANEVAQIRESIRVAGGLSGITSTSGVLLGNPMIYLFLGYASTRDGADFKALAFLENAEYYAYERNYCNKKIVRELSSIGRYDIITRLEKEFNNTQVFENLTFGLGFSPSGMNIRTFKIVKCLIFSSDIETVMSDTNYERIYSRAECYGG